MTIGKIYPGGPSLLKEEVRNKGRIQRYRKIKESTGIQQTIQTLHAERKKRRDLKRQLVYIVKLSLKAVRE